MDLLPQELIDHISSYLDFNDLKNTLLLSRKFQYAAEQFSEAFADYNLTSENASKFVSTYSGRQFRYLRNVSFATSVFPRDDDAEEYCRDTANELRAMDEDFTRQIKFLFETLKGIEERSDGVYGLGKIHLTIYTPTRAINEDSDCRHHKFVSWRVHLLSPSVLPSLGSICSLTVETPEQRFYDDGPDPVLRKLDLRIILDIASKCPNLEFLQCKLGGDDWQTGFKSKAIRAITRDWGGPRRDSRHDFGEGLEGLKDALPLLRHVQLDFLYPLHLVERIDQHSALPNLTKPATYDPFSRNLRLLSCQLRTMSLRVVVDEALFWPPDENTPYWPNLETVSIMFHMSTPSGSWYFQGLPGVGATQGYELDADSYPPLAATDQDYEDEDVAADLSWQYQYVIAQFRVDPNEEALIPFITAFARAAASMPSLKEFILWSPLSIRCLPDSDAYENFDVTQVTKFPEAELAWGIAYAKPGIEAFRKCPGENYSSDRQIWWQVAKWRPDAKLHHLFQSIGRERHGEGLLEYWDDGYAGQGLGYRYDFENWEGGIWYIDA